MPFFLNVRLSSRLTPAPSQEVAVVRRLASNLPYEGKRNGERIMGSAVLIIRAINDKKYLQAIDLVSYADISKRKKDVLSRKIELLNSVNHTKNIIKTGSISYSPTLANAAGLTERIAKKLLLESINEAFCIECTYIGDSWTLVDTSVRPSRLGQA